MAIRQATMGDLPLVTDILCEAFSQDQVVDWMVRRDGRERALRRFFEITCGDLALRQGETYLADDGAAVAVWTPPGGWHLPVWRQARRLLDWGGIFGWGRFQTVARGSVGLEEHHPRDAHYYLMFLGVRPARQGQGLGGALLSHQLRRCDQEGAAAYLENSNQRNLPLYGRHGFAVTGEHRLGEDGPPLWLMWRPPGS
ncbi:MAG TPA: GNAT family N-acetyltransferase [Candidatus Dormibacteraeota bacterium]|nr:GNAT family N-acetyltransferase [Candidatus Dormibacteraeota bacterium]